MFESRGGRGGEGEGGEGEGGEGEGGRARGGRARGGVRGVGGSHIKMVEVHVGNFQKAPQRVPESHCVGAAQIHFHPSEIPIFILKQHSHVIFC